MIRATVAGIGLCLVIGGCASSAKNIAPAYVSPITYQQYDCVQLSGEAQRVTANAQRVAGVQDEKATNDAVATGVAVVLFWPAAFFVSGGDGRRRRNSPSCAVRRKRSSRSRYRRNAVSRSRTLNRRRRRRAGIKCQASCRKVVPNLRGERPGCRTKGAFGGGESGNGW